MILNVEHWPVHGSPEDMYRVRIGQYDGPDGVVDIAINPPDTEARKAISVYREHPAMDIDELCRKGEFIAEMLYIMEQYY